MPGVNSPSPLADELRLDGFDCGEAILNNCLIQRALKNQASGASRTFVVCTEDKQAAGYYALSAGSVAHKSAPTRIKRNMPDPMPVAVLGRLAVDLNWQEKGLGQDLLTDAIKRISIASEQIGIRAIIVHALHDKAKSFNTSRGFKQSPTDALNLLITLDEVRRFSE